MANGRNDQRFARRVQDVLVRCGLSQGDYSVGGGRVVDVSQVLPLSMLAGQILEDCAAHASVMASGLGMAEVWSALCGDSAQQGAGFSGCHLRLSVGAPH